MFSKHTVIQFRVVLSNKKMPRQAYCYSSGKIDTMIRCNPAVSPSEQLSIPNTARCCPPMVVFPCFLRTSLVNSHLSKEYSASSVAALLVLCGRRYQILRPLMDPLSITASALGITQFAISSIVQLHNFINDLTEAEEVVQDIASNLEGVRRLLAALEELTISDPTIYTAAKADLEKTGVVEAVNNCGQACANFTDNLKR